jgi:hypothetical protein
MRKFLDKIMPMALVFIIVIACNNEVDSELDDIPVIYTESVTDISTEGARFSAKIINLGKDEILDHGFIYSTFVVPTSSPLGTISMGNILMYDKFSVFVSSGLVANRKYYVQSFIKTQGKTYYGKKVSFFSNGSSSPK